MEFLSLKSCAKINIGLNILRKRPDGYHDLETIFYPINLCDNILFRKSDKLSFQSNNPRITFSEDNLIIKAVKKIEILSSKSFPVNITLEKNIPLGGGLGGGSSNAAAALIALNNLYDLKLTEPQLIDIAFGLGSDVPFFVKSKPCFAWSRGEKMDPIDLRINYPILIVNPGIHVSTKWAFENIKPSVPLVSLRELIKYKDTLEFSGILSNDFEEPVFKEYPEIEKIKQDLYKSGALFSSMSGSGSTVYGIFKTIQNAENALLLFNKNYITFIHHEIN